MMDEETIEFDSCDITLLQAALRCGLTYAVVATGWHPVSSVVSVHLGRPDISHAKKHRLYRIGDLLRVGHGCAACGGKGDISS